MRERERIPRAAAVASIAAAVALFLSVVALAFSVRARARSNADREARPGLVDRTRSVSGEAAEMRRLRTRLLALEESVAVLRTRADDGSVELLAAVRERVAALEVALDRQASGARPPQFQVVDPAPTRRRRPDLTRDWAQVGAWQERTTDPTVSPEHRIAALAELRSIDPGSGVRTEDVTRSMLDLFDELHEPRDRAAILRQLKGVTYVFAADRMIEALSDPHEKVREEAAESLAPFRGNESVALALERVVAEDRDPEVRAQADRALASVRR